MQNARLDQSQVRIKSAGRNINSLRYTDETTLMAEHEQELRSLLMRFKEEREKAGFKTQYSKKQIMASGPITLCQIDGGKVDTVTVLFPWVPKSLWMVTAAKKLKDTCSLEEKL